MNPEALISLPPVMHGFEFLRVETIHPSPALPVDRHNPDPAQHAEVFRDGRLGNLESLDQFPDRVRAAAPERVDDLAPPRLGNCVESIGRSCRSWPRNLLYSHMGMCQAEKSWQGDAGHPRAFLEGRLRGEAASAARVRPVPPA